ncbi:hypothetical protein F9K07_00175 [Hydrogenophaga sp. BPS33]|nr:hypothetical protein F9K07_00175 [Hydrogenophaga sp. BPS33]
MGRRPLTAFEHFNEVHPHSSLSMKSPREFRQQQIEQLRSAQHERMQRALARIFSAWDGAAHFPTSRMRLGLILRARLCRCPFRLEAVHLFHGVECKEEVPCPRIGPRPHG